MLSHSVRYKLLQLRSAHYQYLVECKMMKLCLRREIMNAQRKRNSSIQTFWHSHNLILEKICARVEKNSVQFFSFICIFDFRQQKHRFINAEKIYRVSYMGRELIHFYIFQPQHRKLNDISSEIADWHGKFVKFEAFYSSQQVQM